MAAGDLPDIDFGRTYLRFSTTRVNHTPRLDVDAACALIGPDGDVRRYFLTCPCIGERMYVRQDMILEPPCEFNLIAAPDDQFLMTKRHASAEHDVRTAHRFGEVMPTHDGEGAKVIELAVDVNRHAVVRPVQTCEDFRQALVGNRPMNGRTTFLDEDGVTTVVMDYPLRTVNVANDKEAWQVDAGPVLLPAFDPAGDLEVSRFGTAFMVFNAWDYAELVIRQPTPVGGGDARTNHYSLRRGLHGRNGISCAD